MVTTFDVCRGFPEVYLTILPCSWLLYGVALLSLIFRLVFVLHLFGSQGANPPSILEASRTLGQVLNLEKQRRSSYTFCNA